MDRSSINNLHVTILSSPGVGHLVPVLLLANRLAEQHKVRATVLLVTIADAPPESNLLNFTPVKELVEVVQLPPVDISHLIDPSTKVVTQLCLMLREALPYIRSAVAAMDCRPDALIVDIFGTEALPIASEFNIPKYAYIPSTAWFTALTVYCPVLDGKIQGPYVDEPEYLRIPGCKSVRPEVLMDEMLDRNDQQYHEYVRIGNELSLFDGILLNSWEDLEPKTFQAFRDNEALKSVIPNAPVYPIGPLTRPVEPSGITSTELKEWSDKQPNESVLFVSFGSGGVLSAKQITELAKGLELSEQRFVWVIRPPTTGRVDDAFFSPAGKTNKSSISLDNKYNFLPEGFLTNTQNRGILVPMWAQQVEILNHPSIGGFLSHCGWNSSLESIASGVPMIAWPLYAEQKLNATLLTEELGVAIRPQVLPTNRVVGKEEIEKMIRALIQHGDGQTMRDKIKQLKISAINALSQINGSSRKSMSKFLSNIIVNQKILVGERACMKSDDGYVS